MVGGKQKVFDACKDILAAMGSSVTRCGDVGAGNTTKLANQIIVACNIRAVAEAFTLAQKAGVLSGCRLMGIDPEEVPYIGFAERWGAGSTEIREDDIIPLNEPQSSRKYPADRQRII